MKEIAEKYFENFNNHDIVGLSDLYTDDIFLKDWTTTLVGKDEVLSFSIPIPRLINDIS